jgi:hypothetical protein
MTLRCKKSTTSVCHYKRGSKKVRIRKLIKGSLRELLDENGWRNRRLLCDAGVSPSAVSSYLSGKRGTALDFGPRTRETVREMMAAGVELNDLEQIRAWRADRAKG